MRGLRYDRAWRPERDIPFLVLVAALALSLVRSVDQPSFTVAAGGTELTLVPADAALAALAAAVVHRLAGRGSLPRPARAVAYAAAAFSAWLLASSAANGGDAVVAAAKLLEFGVLALGVVLFVRRRVQFWHLVWVLVGVNVAAVVYGVLAFFGVPPFAGPFPGERQPSFLGEHDLAALSTMSLLVALGALYVRERPSRLLAPVAGVTGVVGVVLGAAIAGLLALYLAVAAVVGLALVREAVTRRALATTAAVVLVTTGGVLSLRSADLTNFLRFLGVRERVESKYENTAGWGQRLIYVYVGGRIFLDNPILGTGWYGKLPPTEYARYLPDARRRFSDQPSNYFPSARDGFVPQQTYDQVLYELGLVGAALFLVLAGTTAQATLRVGRRWPRHDRDELLAYVPAAWVAALAGSLAGAALFGGIPLAAIFWVTLGVAALAPSLVPAYTAPARREREAELTPAA